MDEAGELVALGRSLFERGFSVGSAGNISVRVAGGYLITPTNSSLGRLDAARISRLDAGWNHIGGDKPSKEVFMHRAVLTARPDAGSVVHLHSTHATAIACLAAIGDTAPIPPLTPYFVMRVGRTLPVLPYHRPGDPAMEAGIHEAAKTARAVLLANHGPVVSGATLRDAVAAAEELEEAARLALLLRGLNPRALTPFSPASAERGKAQAPSDRSFHEPRRRHHTCPAARHSHPLVAARLCRYGGGRRGAARGAGRWPLGRLLLQ